MSTSGRNFHSLAAGARKQLKNCLTGVWKCPLPGCQNKSGAAVECWDGYRPICADHAKCAEECGYKIIWPLTAQEEMENG